MMESEVSDFSKADSSISSTVASEDDNFFDLENNPSKENEIGGDVLDSLHLVVEKSKSQIDQEYREKGANCSNDVSAPVCFPSSELA